MMPEEAPVVVKTPLQRFVRTLIQASAVAIAAIGAGLADGSLDSNELLVAGGAGLVALSSGLMNLYEAASGKA